MIQIHNAGQKSISLFREKFHDGYRFYRLDDPERDLAISISDETLISLVSQFKSKGGIDFFYSRVIAKDENITRPGEVVRDIRGEDGTILWVNVLPI